MVFELERPKQNGVFTQQAQACLADIESRKMNSNNDRHLKSEPETYYTLSVAVLKLLNKNNFLFQTASSGPVSLLFVQNCISFYLYIYSPDWKENDKRAILSASNLARPTSGNDKYCCSKKIRYFGV